MKSNEKQNVINAKRRLRNLKVFYIHLIGYLVLVALLAYNLYIIEDGPYTDSIIWLNLTTIVVWTIFIALHGLNVFRGRLFFKKSWEDKKTETYIKKDQENKTTFWE